MAKRSLKNETGSAIYYANNKDNKEKNMAINMKSKSVIIAIAVLAVIVLGGLFIWPLNLGGKIWEAHSSWYAVHLSNGIVYVGQIKSVNSQTVVLEKAYYMQSYGAGQNNSGESAQFYGLIMQGSEAPLLSDQKIYINRPGVLFWEKLKPGSDMVNKLDEHK
jgi:hypothetical protein